LTPVLGRFSAVRTESESTGQTAKQNDPQTIGVARPQGCEGLNRTQQKYVEVQGWLSRILKDGANV
jgi:hypothetical protein